MKIIKNSKELARLVDENKDLHLEGQDVRIEFQFTREELRDVYCGDLFLMNDDEKFDFNGWNFNGGDFTGRYFNGNNFDGNNFNGWDFNGKKVSYWAFFNCYGSIKCESIEGRRENHAEPIYLDGKLEIKEPEDNVALAAIKLLEEKGYKIIKK